MRWGRRAGQGKGMVVTAPRLRQKMYGYGCHARLDDSPRHPTTSLAYLNTNTNTVGGVGHPNSDGSRSLLPFSGWALRFVFRRAEQWGLPSTSGALRLHWVEFFV